MQDPRLQPEPMLRHFRHSHLPESLAKVSRPFAELAAIITLVCPAGPERTVAYRKLLEAKDCAVRAVVPDPGPMTAEDLCPGASALVTS